jgi:hypothetical protein
MKRMVRTATGAALLALLAVSAVQAQSISLDDNPMMPITTPAPINIPPFGFGAEDPFGLTPGPGLAPSPSLPFASPAPPNWDGSIFSPGVPNGFPPPAFTPNGSWIHAFTTNKPVPAAQEIPIYFSVDRMGWGLPGSSLAVEAAANQQPGDIYRSTRSFINPAAFVGVLPAGGGWVGVLPSAGGGGSNTLAINQSALGLTVVGVPGVLTPAGVPVPPAVPGSHDNVDAFDFTNQVAIGPGGPGVYPVWSYFGVGPLEAADINAGGGGPAGPISGADIFDVAPMTPGTIAVPFAPALTLGLDMIGGPNSDSIDGLVMFDRAIPGGPATGGPGAQPGIDFALFSLAPGSVTLAALGLDAADVFFTDFRGSFGTYAFATDLGVVGLPGGPPMGPSNIDALDIPEPSSLALLALAAAVVLAVRRYVR